MFRDTKIIHLTDMISSDVIYHNNDLCLIIANEHYSISDRKITLIKTCMINVRYASYGFDNICYVL